MPYPAPTESGCGLQRRPYGVSRLCSWSVLWFVQRTETQLDHNMFITPDPDMRGSWVGAEQRCVPWSITVDQRSQTGELICTQSSQVPYVVVDCGPLEPRCTL